MIPPSLSDVGVLGNTDYIKTKGVCYMQRQDKFLILTFEQDAHGNYTKLPFPYGSSATIEVPEETNIVIEKEQLGNTVKTHLFGVVESR